MILIFNPAKLLKTLVIDQIFLLIYYKKNMNDKK